VSLKSKIKHNLDCSVHTIFIDKEKHVLLEINLIHRKKNIEKGASLADRNNTTQMITRSIAHEIKNPLGGIKGAAQLLASELGERHGDYINIIINEVDRLENYVDKMSGPKNEPVFELVNIHSIIERVIKISNTAENNKLIFIKNYDPSIPNVNIDKDMIIQSLLNIVKNAIEASASNSRIEIKTRIERNYTINGSIHKLTAVISVIDYGSGVSEDIKNKLFLPLVTNKFNGSGLGLSISQRLVAINDGIIIFNEENDKTIFKIILPIEAY